MITPRDVLALPMAPTRLHFLTPPRPTLYPKSCSLRYLRLLASSRGPGALTLGARRFLMFLDIHDLERHPVEFTEEFQPGVIDVGEEIHQRTPLKASGRAELVEEQHGKHKVVIDIRLRGTLSAGLELSCARCLEPVAQNVTRDFDLLYRPLGTDAGRDELSVTDAEAEIGYYEGDD